MPRIPGTGRSGDSRRRDFAPPGADVRRGQRSALHGVRCDDQPPDGAAVAVALAVIMGYSYCKRFTWAAHLVLGLSLSIAPVGAYIALTGRFDWEPCVLALLVLTWCGGFDIIYALQGR